MSSKLSFDKKTIIERLKEGAVLGVPIVILEQLKWIPNIGSVLSVNPVAWIQYVFQALILGYVAALVISRVN